MGQNNMLSLKDIRGDLRTYFNWSANALVPFNPLAADHYLNEHHSLIWNVAQKLLKQISYVPDTLYRGLILTESVDMIIPHKNFKYLSFSTDLSVAETFADVKGFGSDVIDLSAKLGSYCYIIEYKPVITEVLFHHDFLTLLPYAEALSLLNMDGVSEVEGLKNQKEVMIFQPAEPFTNIKRR